MDIEKLMAALRLGRLTAEPVSVKGGLLHKMYRVSTTDGTYAVKVLNPEIMKRADALSNTVHSEKIAKAFEGLIPVIASLEIDGRQVHKLGEDYCLVFPWTDATPVFSEEITPHHCEAIGNILGKIHQRNLKMEGIIPGKDSFEMFHWETYLQRIDELKNRDVEWIAAYKKAFKDIKAWNRKACGAEGYLSEYAVISHRDMDPKNVLWRDDKPCVIDWEAAGYVNPYQELLEAINYWTDDGTGKLVKEKYEALTNAYCSYMDLETVMWEKVFDASYIGMLGWLEYNVKRALGTEVSGEAEIRLGEEQVTATIQELYSYQGKVEQLREWLG